MTNYIHGSQYNQTGSNSTMNVTNNNGGGADVGAAVTELRAFIAGLQQAGAVAPDGTVTRPDVVVHAVQNHGGRLRELAAAVGAGAKDAVLKIVQGGIAVLVVGLLGGGL